MAREESQTKCSDGVMAVYPHRERASLGRKSANSMSALRRLSSNASPSAFSFSCIPHPSALPLAAVTATAATTTATTTTTTLSSYLKSRSPPPLPPRQMPSFAALVLVVTLMLSCALVPSAKALQIEYANVFHGDSEECVLTAATPWVTVDVGAEWGPLMAGASNMEARMESDTRLLLRCAGFCRPMPRVLVDFRTHVELPLSEPLQIYLQRAWREGGASSPSGPSTASSSSSSGPSSSAPSAHSKSNASMAAASSSAPPLPSPSSAATSPPSSTSLSSGLPLCLGEYLRSATEPPSSSSSSGMSQAELAGLGLGVGVGVVVVVALAIWIHRRRQRRRLLQHAALDVGKSFEPAGYGATAYPGDTAAGGGPYASAATAAAGWSVQGAAGASPYYQGARAGGGLYAFDSLVYRSVSDGSDFGSASTPLAAHASARDHDSLGYGSVEGLGGRPRPAYGRARATAEDEDSAPLLPRIRRTEADDDVV